MGPIGILESIVIIGLVLLTLPLLLDGRQRGTSVSSGMDIGHSLRSPAGLGVEDILKLWN